jgi:hypothetical protein
MIVREREELGNQDFAGPSVKLDRLYTARGSFTTTGSSPA